MNKSQAMKWLIKNVTRWPAQKGGIFSAPKGWFWDKFNNGTIKLVKSVPTEMYADCHIEQGEWLDGGSKEVDKEAMKDFVGFFAKGIADGSIDLNKSPGTPCVADIYYWNPDSWKDYKSLYEYEKIRADALQVEMNSIDILHYDECEKLRAEIAMLKQQLRMKKVN